MSEEDILAYIGQTGRDLRQRLAGLRGNALAEKLPFNDPHTAVPSLWTWKDAEGYQFECSAAQLSITQRNRLAIECWLLWKYRLERGESTLCNHGRFHPAYVKSKNRSTGFRGEQLNREVEPSIASSTPPLQLAGTPTSDAWMELHWSEWTVLSDIRVLPSRNVLYRIKQADDSERLLYIGETATLKQRIAAHARRSWGETPVLFSVSTLADSVVAYQRHELENDLIAAYWEERNWPPAMQFMLLSA